MVDAGAGGDAGVTVDLAAGTATDGFGAQDQLANIENITGTEQSDQLTGNDEANVIQGNAGDDVIGWLLRRHDHWRGRTAVGCGRSGRC